MNMHARIAAMGAIVNERERQDDLKARGEFAYTPADEIPASEAAVILGEEVGEVNRAILEHGADSPQLADELVQVAAVALAWIEGIYARRAPAAVAVE